MSAIYETLSTPTEPPGFGSDPSADDEAIAAIVEALRTHTGLDVREYRRPTVERRIRNRMISVASPTFGAYARLIERSSEEAFALLERVSIKVSEFYRNAGVFDVLHSRFLPSLADAARGRPLSIWSAGCGRGEEAWTLAMLLHDLGIDGRIHATDIDSAALSFAQRAEYAVSSAAALPDALANRYLTRAHNNQCVHIDPALRSLIRFATHNLLSDSTPDDQSNFDLICCRNVLIYFQRAAQERTILHLQRHLAPAGLLCLGEAEWPCGPSADHLVPAWPRSRVFQQHHVRSAA